MAASNLDRIGTALDLLSTVLEPFVAETLKRYVPEGQNWAALIAAKDGREGRDYDRRDPQLQLRALTENLGRIGWPFSAKLSRGEQNLASELREVRNGWAHRKPFTADDTYRALDTCERLLRAIGAPAQADTIRTMRTEVRATVYAAENRRVERAAAASMPNLGEAELTPWREVLRPHPDIAAGDFARAEFAADLFRVARGDGSSEYVDPVRFFERTFLTEGLKTLLGMTARRISGDPNAQSVINLQTTFGGGKTHSMLAAWHLAGGQTVGELPANVQEVLAGSTLPSNVRRVAIVGNELAVGQADVKPDGTVVHTIWGELAHQLGGAEGYAIVAEADRTATSPGSALRELIAKYSPSLILIDEWVAYARQLQDRENLVGGTFETQFTFAQLLTETVSAVPGALLLVSIPASDVRFEEANGPHASDLEIGGPSGRAALARLQNVVTRVAHNWTPASSGESFEIVRRRLFMEPDAEGRRRIDATVARFVDFYRRQSGELPPETRQIEYESRLRAAYPIHPELFDRLYGDWSTLERFQKTRGVLRMMSAVVHALYSAEDDSPLIMPGSIPLDAAAVRDEVTAYLDDAWRSIIETDVDGENATPLRIDRSRELFQRRALTRRIARSLFLGSAATASSAQRGIERQRLFLGVAMPGDSVGNFGSALQMLSDQATYLYSESSRYWYDRQPSVNRMVAERAEAIDIESVYAKALEFLRAGVGTAPEFAGRPIIGPEFSADVPEADEVRLVVLHPRHRAVARDQDSPAWRFTLDLVRNRGAAARQNVNTIVAVAALENTWPDVESALRTHMAWSEIVSNVRDLDLAASQADHARRREAESRAVVEQRLSSAWSLALFPTQVDGAQPLSMASLRIEGEERRLAVRAGQKLAAGREDVVILQTSPLAISLTFDRYLRNRWNRGYLSVGELWSYHLRYPYMPRLRDKSVLYDGVRSTMIDAIWPERGFALASSYDESTGDFSDLRLPFEDRSAGVVDDSTLLVAPALAVKQREREREREREPEPDPNDERPGPAPSPSPGPGPISPNPPRPRPVVQNARFDGAVDLKPRQDLAAQLRQLAEEVLVHLQSADPDTLEIRLSISADRSAGFDQDTVRTVSENARNLNIVPSRFTDL